MAATRDEEREELTSLRAVGPILIAEIDPDNGLFASMLSHGTLTERQIERCKAKEGSQAKVDAVLDMLRKQPNASYYTFRDDLRAIKRGDLVDKYLPKYTAGQVPSVDSTPGCSSSGNAQAETELPVTDRDYPDVPVVDVVKTTESEYQLMTTQQDVYPMSKQIRGVACIISIYHIDGAPADEDRDGTEKDYEKLKSLFEQMHFKVEVLTDDDGLSAQEIRGHIKRTTSRKQQQCYVLFVLAHGNIEKSREEYFIATDGKKVFKSDVLNIISENENLSGVPRLVCFICCRGKNVEELDATRRDWVQPTGDNLLIGLPCQENFASLRSTLYGTRYVRCLVKLFMERAHNTDAETILNDVNTELLKLVTHTKEHQTAECHSSLEKQLYFFPGIVLP